MTTKLWTKRDEQKAIDGWNKGLDCAGVARSLGVSKSAVVSKLHRLNANGDKRFIRPYGGHVPKEWTDQELLDLLAIKAIKRPADKWSWKQVADYFGCTIKQAEYQYRIVMAEYRASEAA